MNIPDNDEPKREVSPYLPQAARANDEEPAAEQAAEPEEQYPFVLPDAECFHVLAGLAGKIELKETGADNININRQLKAVEGAIRGIYDGFVSQDLQGAAEQAAEAMTRILCVAAVCEAHFPGVFAGEMEKIYLKLTDED